MSKRGRKRRRGSSKTLPPFLLLSSTEQQTMLKILIKGCVTALSHSFLHHIKGCVTIRTHVARPNERQKVT